MSYLKERDVKLSVRPSSLSWCESNRALLHIWVLSVAHYLKCSQETLYHGIDLADRCFAKKRFHRDKIQLVGTTCLLIASKLEEYYPADIDTLVKLTDRSYTAKEITNMELEILSLVDFVIYGKEPMAFLNRYTINAVDSPYKAFVTK